MVQKLAVVILGIIAILGVAMMTWQVKSLTGEFSAGSGVGNWYAGKQIVQLQPDEACSYSGHPPNTVPTITRDERFGTLISICGDGAAVPATQTAYVSGPKEYPIFIG